MLSQMRESMLGQKLQYRKDSVAYLAQMKLCVTTFRSIRIFLDQTSF